MENPTVKLYNVPSRSTPGKKWLVRYFPATNTFVCECPRASWGRIKNDPTPCYHEEKARKFVAQNRGIGKVPNPSK